jgi:hypothetical protein
MYVRLGGYGSLNSSTSSVFSDPPRPTEAAHDMGEDAPARTGARTRRLAYIFAIGWVAVCLALYAFQALNLACLVG